MQVQINGRQIELGEALRERVDQRVREITGKYADRAVDAVVSISRDGYNFRADAKIHLPTGLLAQASAASSDAHAAFDACAERLEKQLRRHKRRLTRRHAERQEPVESAPAAAYVLRVEEEPEADGAQGEPAEPAEPVVVAETTLALETITVGEAVMRLELADAPFLMFRSRRDGGVNLVYRREDGHIGWIDPDGPAARQV